MRLLLLLCLCFSTSLLIAQSSSINNKTTFKDGLYKTYEEFLLNEPSIPLSDLRIKIKNSRFFNKLRIQYIKEIDKTKGKWQKMNLSDAWGICIDGMPYIQYEVFRPNHIKIGTIEKDFFKDGDFTRIRIIGSLCHFNIEDYYASGATHVVRESINSSIAGSKLISQQKVLKLRIGAVCDFTEEGMGLLIQDDEALYDRFQNDPNKDHKLFLYLQAYNYRNPFSINSIPKFADR